LAVLQSLCIASVLCIEYTAHSLEAVCTALEAMLLCRAVLLCIAVLLY